MSESKTSQRRLRAAERQRQALELRKAGVSFEEIARTLGYAGPSSSYRAIMSALKRTLQEPADEVRKLELVRLDRAQRVAWERMLQGDLEALAKVIKVMERRARLLGLDMPTKVASTDSQGEDLALTVERELYLLSDEQAQAAIDFLRRMRQSVPAPAAALPDGDA